MNKNYFLTIVLALVFCWGGVGCSSNNDPASPVIPDPDIPTITTIASSCTYQSGDVANYQLALSTVALDSEGKPTGVGDIYTFNIYSGQPLNLAKPMPSNGTYTLASTNAANTISPIGSKKESYKLSGNGVILSASENYTAVSLVVTQTSDTFSITAELTLSSGTQLQLVASDIAYPIQTLDIPTAVAYRCEYYGGDPSNVLLILSTTALNEDRHPIEDGDLYLFDIYANQPKDQFNPMPEEGVYTLSDSYEAQTLGSDISGREPWRKNGGDSPIPGEIEPYTSAKLTITHTGDTFTAVADLILSNGESFKIQATNIICPVPSAGEVTHNVDLTADFAEAFHYALSDANGNVKLSGYIVDLVTADEEEWITLRIQGPVAPIKDNVPTGTFQLRDAFEPYVAIPGGYDVTIRKPYGCYYATHELAAAYLASGEITITKTGAVYTFVIDGLSDKGLAIKGKYTGVVSIKDGGATAYNTTLIDDRQIDFSGVKEATALYYGDVYGVGSGAWNIYLDPKAANKDGFDIQVFDASPTSQILPTGTFSGSMGGKAGTFYSGYIFNALLYPTMFYQYGSNVQKDYYSTIERAPIQSGSVTITKSGSNYVFDINSIDDRGHKVTGTWTGPVTVSKGN